MGYLPYNLVYESEARLQIKEDYPNIREYNYDPQDVADACLTDLDLLDEHREEASSNVDKWNESLTSGYVARIIPKSFKDGDLIFRRVDVSTPNLASRKLVLKWKGPYRVTSASVFGACMLDTIDGVAMPRSWHPINLCYYEQSQ